ncbi:purine-cytosine permease family protein [Pseudarthrobacter phenanthrenivorans]|uniref:Membrane protein n=1 Tax=Pseudarthrobacter phenanthrenivorans TaxID=361575 RepID=A0A0B4D2P1_PSEPS|nr:membrane protein [Pseudarthrobacter phenanthrenivorans]KIC67609.1 membrane protein [Pseudarthrobacter phenanthrenivorans]
MSQDLDTPQLLERAAPAGGPAVGRSPASAAAGNTAALNATKESLEDYTLRFAPRSYRKWSAGVVATSALGGIAYLADFSIGANIGISYGTVNAILGILVAAVVIFATGFPLAYYAARYNIDLDLITRGSGFGYYGSVVTNVIFATFTFIFFALEGSIMAQGLELGLGVPQWLGYAASTVIIIPLVIYGMNTLAKLQVWTTPLWLLLMVVPVGYLLVSHPGSIDSFFAYTGASGDGGPNLASVMLAAGVCLSLMAQIAEQIDYLRFMPPRTDANRAAWWRAVILAGPGWVIFGAIKQIVGLFIAIYLIATLDPAASATANEPVHQFLGVYQEMMPAWLAMTLAVVLVVISQIKINVTNAYSGSLAWTNSFTRITKTYPGRMVFVVVNLLIALVLMEANMFDFLNTILGFYANCAMAWVVTVASDIAINKYLLKISPKVPEFRRGMLYAVNPVGFVSMLVSAGVSIAVFFGAFGAAIQPYSPIFAVGLALVLPPALAVLTRGRYYLRRLDDGIDLPMFDADGNPSDARLRCHVTGLEFERPDMVRSAQDAPDGGPQYVSSLALSTDKTGELVLPGQK